MRHWLTIILPVVLTACGMPASLDDTPPLVEQATRTAGSTSSPVPSAVLVAAGDIAECDGAGDEATAALLDDIPGTVAALGDLAYPKGRYEDFAQCYLPSWGRHKERTRPAPGNHDFGEKRGAAYYEFFGPSAGELGKGYYSYELGSWHIIVLNSECHRVGCERGSEQETWLREDLAKHPARCILAYWHEARFSSGRYGNNADYEPFWQALYEYEAEVVMVGHDHLYERFAPQKPDGTLDRERGIRQFVVGTGGGNLRSFRLGDIQPNSEVREHDTWGVLKLTLHQDSYDWQFVPVKGKTFTDTGNDTCH